APVQAVPQRLPEAEIDAEGQRRAELGEPRFRHAWSVDRPDRAVTGRRPRPDATAAVEVPRRDQAGRIACMFPIITASVSRSSSAGLNMTTSVPGWRRTGACPGGR